MNNEARKRLQDISDACAAVARFTNGKLFSHYQAEEMLRAAVERKLEIIGEAFSKLQAAGSSEVKQFPELRRIVAMPNRIIHGYDTVDEELVWDVVKNKLPALRQ